MACKKDEEYRELIDEHLRKEGRVDYEALLTKLISWEFNFKVRSDVIDMIEKNANSASSNGGSRKRARRRR
jgi:hypothetical protein